MKDDTLNYGKRSAIALSVLLLLATLTGCSTLDDVIAAAPVPASTSAPTTTEPDGTTSTTSESTATTAPPVTEPTPTTSSAIEPPETELLSNGSTPGISAVTCPGDFLGYGVTSGFEFALCDTDNDRALLRRINLFTGDTVEGSACLGDKIWSAYIADWRYDIDLAPATPDLVIIDANGQLFLREALSDYTFLTNDWESRHFC